jgi:alpha/beta superfamily hydrolase
LRGELAYPFDDQPEFAALVVGPHPYMGGTMQNALVACISEELAFAGGVSLRFDFSAPGGTSGRRIDIAASMAEFWSTGRAPEDPTRLRNAETAFCFLEALGVQPLVLIGYSFGAAAVWRLWMERREQVAAVALISPTLARHAFERPDATIRPPCMLVIHSVDDFCTPHGHVAQWVAGLSFPVSFTCHEAGNHFFRGSERCIAREVAGFASGSLASDHRSECAPC